LIIVKNILLTNGQTDKLITGKLIYTVGLVRLNISTAQSQKPESKARFKSQSQKPNSNREPNTQKADL
jgi:hypothetical protein